MLTKSSSFHFLIIFCVLTGCSDISPTSAPNPTESNTHDSENYPKITLISNHPQKGVIQDTRGSLDTSLLETWFNKIDWENSNPSSIQVERDEEHSLTLIGLSKADENNVKFFAQWKHPPKEANEDIDIVIQQSEPFDDAAKAKRLLKLFLERDTNFESSIKWTSTGSGKR